MIKTDASSRRKHFSWTYSQVPGHAKSAPSARVSSFAMRYSLGGLMQAMHRGLGQDIYAVDVQQFVDAIHASVTRSAVYEFIDDAASSILSPDAASAAMDVALQNKEERITSYAESASEMFRNARTRRSLMVGVLNQLAEERAELIIEYSKFARDYASTPRVSTGLLVAVMEEVIDVTALEAVETVYTQMTADSQGRV